MDFICKSGHSRDVIVMSIRTVALLNYLGHSKIIYDILEGMEGEISIAVELERSINELNDIVSLNYTLKQEKRKYRLELRALEKELADTIEAYQELLSGS